MNKKVEEAVSAIKQGSFVAIYDGDGREEETDLVIASESIMQEHILQMRKDAGGLICTTVPHEVADTIGLPFMVDIYSTASDRFPIFKGPAHKLPYDTRSAFSITINHTSNYTGITDTDRSTTISRFGELVGKIKSGVVKDAIGSFQASFRTPGHVPLLRCAEGLLEKRKGHTELATALMIMAGVSPSATVCEMMGDNGRALPREKAREYAEEKGLIYLDGKDVTEAWKEWSE